LEKERAVFSRENDVQKNGSERSRHAIITQYICVLHTRLFFAALTGRVAIFWRLTTQGSRPSGAADDGASLNRWMDQMVK
jgi:hypothetical protein